MCWVCEQQLHCNLCSGGNLYLGNYWERYAECNLRVFIECDGGNLGWIHIIRNVNEWELFTNMHNFYEHFESSLYD